MWTHIKLLSCGYFVCFQSEHGIWLFFRNWTIQTCYCYKHVLLIIFCWVCKWCMLWNNIVQTSILFSQTICNLVSLYWGKHGCNCKCASVYQRFDVRVSLFWTWFPHDLFVVVDLGFHVCLYFLYLYLETCLFLPPAPSIHCMGNWCEQCSIGKHLHLCK